VFRELRSALEVTTADEPVGTAGESAGAAISFAGKSGSAETAGGGKSHAWFVGFAPASTPQVALVVVLEHGGDARQSAVPIATRLVERMRQLGYVDRDESTQREGVARVPVRDSIAD